MINIKSVGMGAKCYFPQVAEKVVEKSINTSPRTNAIAYVTVGAHLIGTFIPRKLVKVTFKRNRLNSWKEFGNACSA